MKTLKKIILVGSTTLVMGLTPIVCTIPSNTVFATTTTVSSGKVTVTLSDGTTKTIKLSKIIGKKGYYIKAKTRGYSIAYTGTNTDTSGAIGIVKWYKSKGIYVNGTVIAMPTFTHTYSGYMEDVACLLNNVIKKYDIPDISDMTDEEVYNWLAENIDVFEEFYTYWYNGGQAEEDYGNKYYTTSRIALLAWAPLFERIAASSDIQQMTVDNELILSGSYYGKVRNLYRSYSSQKFNMLTMCRF